MYFVCVWCVYCLLLISIKSSIQKKILIYYLSFFHGNLGDAHYMHDMNTWICKPNSYNTGITGYFQSPPLSFFPAPPPPQLSRPCLFLLFPIPNCPFAYNTCWILRSTFKVKFLTLRSEQYYHNPFWYWWGGRMFSSVRFASIIGLLT